MELEKIIFHDDYNPETVQHDIALLKLKQPVDLAVRSSFDRFSSLALGVHTCVPAKIRGEVHWKSWLGVRVGHHSDREECLPYFEVYQQKSEHCLSKKLIQLILQGDNTNSHQQKKVL